MREPYEIEDYINSQIEKFKGSRMNNGGDFAYRIDELEQVLKFIASEPPCDHVYGVGFDPGGPLPYRVNSNPPPRNETFYFQFWFCPYCGVSLTTAAQTAVSEEDSPS